MGKSWFVLVSFPNVEILSFLFCFPGWPNSTQMTSIPAKTYQLQPVALPVAINSVGFMDFKK
jgi:hypothetical protein